MAKDTIKFILVIIILAIVLNSLGIIPELFGIVTLQTAQFTSYTQPPRATGSYCDIESFWNNYNLIASPNPTIPTLLSDFRFETTTYTSRPIYDCIETPIPKTNLRNIQETYIDNEGCQHWSYESGSSCIRITGNPQYECPSKYGWSWCIRNLPEYISNGICSGQPLCRDRCSTFTPVEDYGGSEQTGTEQGCFYTSKIYKDNQLIDEIDEITNEIIFKSYNDNGEILNIDLPSGESGLEVQFADQIFYNSVCSDDFKCSVKHYYKTYTPEGYIDIEVSPVKEQYLEGEDIDINIDVINDFSLDFLAKLEVKYEVPTILGTKEKIEVYDDLIIDSGTNEFSYNIPTEFRTEQLDVTPTINIYRPTSVYSGINVLQGFEEFGTSRASINAHDRLKIYSYIEDTETIRIKSEAESLREEIDLLEGDIDALQNLLNEKAYLLNQLELTLQEQIDIIDEYELLIEEKAYLVSQLELNLEEQAQLVSELSSISEEQVVLIDALELSVEEQAQLIDEMELTLQEQTTIINELDLSNQQQAQLIDDLELNIQQKAQIISNF